MFIKYSLVQMRVRAGLCKFLYYCFPVLKQLFSFYRLLCLVVRGNAFQFIVTSYIMLPASGHSNVKPIVTFCRVRVAGQSIILSTCEFQITLTHVRIIVHYTFGDGADKSSNVGSEMVGCIFYFGSCCYHSVFHFVKVSHKRQYSSRIYGL